MKTALTATDAPPLLRAIVLFFAGTMAWVQGDDEDARRLQQTELALAEAIDSDVDRARAKLLGAFLAWREGAFERMATLAGEALSLFEAQPEPMGVAITLFAIAAAARGQGALSVAMARLSAVEIRCRELGFVWAQAAAQYLAGEVARDQHDVKRAAHHFGESLALYHAQRDPWGIAAGLAGLGTVAMMCGEAETAVRLLAAAGKLADTVGVALPPVDTGAHDQFLADARSALGEEAFAAARRAGEALPRDVAIAEAEAVARAAQEQASTANRHADLAALTEREMDVARLVARGLTNKQIAAALLISPNTVKSYLDDIRDKLGLHNKAEIAAHMTRLGLG